MVFQLYGVTVYAEENLVLRVKLKTNKMKTILEIIRSVFNIKTTIYFIVIGNYRINKVKVQ